VPSNLECVGCGVEDEQAYGALIEATVPTAQPLGSTRMLNVLRWEDPSGARLVFTMNGNELLAFLPSFAGTPGATLVNVSALSDEVVQADVQDTDGEMLTRLALELEQGPLLGRRSVAEAVQASVVGLGVDVQAFADEDEFGASDASLMGEAGDVGEPMPERYAELGITGPLRFAAESFISFGLFDGTEPTAHAWLAGTVQRSERRRVELTEQSFVVARVRSTGSRRTSACRTPEKIRSRSRPGDREHGLPRLDRGSPRPTRVRGRRRAARPGSSPRTPVTERGAARATGGSSGPPHS
jgi:hypothetical protein